MTRRAPLVVLTFALPICAACAQTADARWSFFPDDLLFTPLVSNHEEARVGLQQELGSSLLTVGVGNTSDLIQYAAGSDTIRWGGDFYVYALSNSFKDIRLKIDAADGFFGMHITWKGETHWSFRFRALHLSAHFVDGHYDPDAKVWKDGREPIPFSRNYGEVVAAHESQAAGIFSRLYAGLSYAVYNNPHDIRRWAGLAGAELAGVGPLYVACNLSLLGVPTYNLNVTVEGGVKLGAWKGRGVRLYLVYYDGLDVYGEYYKERKEFVGAGFSIDFW